MSSCVFACSDTKYYGLPQYFYSIHIFQIRVTYWFITKISTDFTWPQVIHQSVDGVLVRQLSKLDAMV